MRSRLSSALREETRCVGDSWLFQQRIRCSLLTRFRSRPRRIMRRDKRAPPNTTCSTVSNQFISPWRWALSPGLRLLSGLHPRMLICGSASRISSYLHCGFIYFPQLCRWISSTFPRESFRLVSHVRDGATLRKFDLNQLSKRLCQGVMLIQPRVQRHPRGALEELSRNEASRCASRHQAVRLGMPNTSDIARCNQRCQGG